MLQPAAPDFRRGPKLNAMLRGALAEVLPPISGMDAPTHNGIDRHGKAVL